MHFLELVFFSDHVLVFLELITYLGESGRLRLDFADAQADLSLSVSTWRKVPFHAKSIQHHLPDF